MFIKLTVHHYENMPIKIYRKFHLQKLKTVRLKNFDIYHISAQNIDCGYSLEPPRRGGSNEYPQSMVLSRNKKNNCYITGCSIVLNNMFTMFPKITFWNVQHVYNNMMFTALILDWVIFGMSWKI